MTGLNSKTNNEYYLYLMNLVGGDHRFGTSYSILFDKLLETEFTYVPYIPLDENRLIDGLALRDGFLISDKCPVSVMEVLIKIALRYCQEYSGDSVSNLFWDMLHNLELDSMDDPHYDDREVTYILDRFLNRKYTFDGLGNIFCITDSEIDFRKTEIWQQLMYYTCVMGY